MSIFIEETLQEWGLEEYIEKFKEEQIDTNASLYMSDSMVKELIPIIGKRFCFLENRKKLLEIRNNKSITDNSDSVG
ncbi:uncharacterized protein LOC109503716 [Harpegnathos saltator]|uniref:uncharacterized protein LOC109503716 n=1 Tax=Harpegnathos saltator TaxID=610380 RepID=UPI000948989A|nr:uncharacterized protein LOC109503716 [Harpegnathos saltator]